MVQHQTTSHAQVPESMATFTVAAAHTVTVVQRTTSKTKASTVAFKKPAANLLMEAVKLVFPLHPTQQVPLVFPRTVIHAVQLSTRNVPPVSAVPEATSAETHLISVVLPTGVNQAGVFAQDLRKVLVLILILMVAQQQKLTQTMMMMESRTGNSVIALTYFVHCIAWHRMALDWDVYLSLA